MSLFDLPDLKFLLARLHQQELSRCMRDCHARRLMRRSGWLGLLVGAWLTTLGRTAVRIGERLSGTPAAGRR
jgi:hypothetical protein